MAELLEFFRQIVEPGMVVYTFLLGMVLLYWLIVIIGFVGMDVLDFDFGLDGVEGLEGVDGVEGIEGIEGAADGLDSVGEAAEGTAGALKAMLGFLNFGKVPVTIIGSFLILKLWILAYLYHVYLSPIFQGWLSWIPALILAGIVFVVAFLAAVFLTSLTTRPLRRVFEHRPTHSQYHLIGKTCKVKTSKVTATFGQAALKVDDSHLLLSVRCPEENSFAKGDEAVIADYDKDKDVYLISRR